MADVKTIEEGGSVASGMTVRDAFAAQFVAGGAFSSDGGHILIHPEVEAERAYRFADAMMKARAMPELPPLGGGDVQLFDRQVYELCRSMMLQARTFRDCPSDPRVPDGMTRAVKAAGLVICHVLWGLSDTLAGDKMPGRLEDLAEQADHWFRKNYPQAVRNTVADALADVFGIDPTTRRPPNPGNDTGPG
jgi:hypothetical protein